MMTFKTGPVAATAQQSGRFDILVEWGVLTNERLHKAQRTARARGMDIEQVLTREFGVTKHNLLAALSEYYNCPFVEYDERMPVPPELLQGLDNERLSILKWFPIMREGGTVVIAANDPHDGKVFDDVRASIQADRYEFWVALDEDIQWYIQDFLHARPGALIGTERTGLAYWRNTMAHWRTRLACYRNDLAKGRTDLAVLRWGLGLIALSDVLMRSRPEHVVMYLYWAMIAVGAALGIFGLKGYLHVRRTRMKAPGHTTLVEVTAATMQFLENYQDLDQSGGKTLTKETMLARLGDSLGGYSTILYPSPASKERTHLARERNVLAGQRTLAACYRTIYARARTGLSFIRTGVTFTSLGLGLLRYFGPGLLTVADVLMIAAGLFLIVDGLLWYLPVRKEQAEIPRSPALS